MNPPQHNVCRVCGSETRPGEGHECRDWLDDVPRVSGTTTDWKSADAAEVDVCSLDEVEDDWPIRKRCWEYG